MTRLTIWLIAGLAIVVWSACKALGRHTTGPAGQELRDRAASALDTLQADLDRIKALRQEIGRIRAEVNQIRLLAGKAPPASPDDTPKIRTQP